MLDPFKSSDYRTFLVELVRERKLRGITQTDLARVMGCQPAYLSQVLPGRADLTEEHVLRLCGHLGLSDPETEYLLLLLRLQKAGGQLMRTYLERRIRGLRKSSNSLEPKLTKTAVQNDLEMSSYYASSWIPSAIHALTDCEVFQTSAAIAKRLQIEEAVVKIQLQRLERFGLIKIKKGRWVHAGESIHFSKNSDLDFQLQTARRLAALQNLALKRESDLHYSSVFTTDTGTAEEIRKEFFRIIEKLHQTIEPTRGEDAYSICLDAFRL